MNRTIVESARCMLAESKLPKTFWGEAVSTAVYLRNRSPTTSVKGMTPMEALTGRKPNVESLRVFGCMAFAPIPKDERQKFDSKSRRCIFRGYGETVKGYRLYDTCRKKILFSRDVIFDEAKLGIMNESVVQKEPVTKVLPVELSDEEDASMADGELVNQGDTQEEQLNKENVQVH